MSTALVAPHDPAIDLELIPAMQTHELRSELARVLGVTARNLLYLAAIWRELESRSEDLTGLRSGLIAYLPLIASGEVLPETVVRFAGSKHMLGLVAGLPRDQQRKLADGDPVLVVVRQGGALTHRMLPVHSLNRVQLRQVFGDRCVRSEPEQIAMLEAPTAEPVPRKPVFKGKVSVDRSAGTVRVGSNIVPAQDVIDALRAAGLVK